MKSLIEKDTILRVSSVLNKDTKQYGKQFLIDGRDDTCWNSDQGENQWITLKFDQSHHVSRIDLQFQGGFSAHKVVVEFFLDKTKCGEKVIYPEDNNRLQTFDDFSDAQKVDNLKLLLCESSDLFGRIIIYKLEILGTS